MPGFVGDSRLAHHPLGHGMVEVISPQTRVTAGGQHLEYPPVEAQNRNIEGTATEIEDGVDALGVTIQAIGNGSSGRLVEQTEHVQAGQPCSILGGLPLRVVEIRGHGNDNTGQRTPQGRFRPMRQIAQNLSGHLYRADSTRYGANTRYRAVDFDEFIRQPITKRSEV